MGQLVLKDNAASTLAVSLSATAGSGQTVTIAGSGAKFPTVTGTDWSHLTIFDGAGNIETMKVTAHAAGAASFTVSRGTAAGITGVTDADVKAWSAGTSTGVACRLVAQVVLDINGAATSAAASAASAASKASNAADSAAAAAVSAASAIPLSQKAAANGVASLNADGKVVQTTLLADSATSATNVTGAATSAFALTADITPTQITANTDNYAPTGLATANTLRLSTDASRDLTGLTGGSDGRLMIVHNVGSNTLVLKNESASSTAANRFAFGGSDVTLAASQSVTLQYDATASRWRSVAGAGGLSIASTAEAQAGSDNTKAISSLRMREGFNATGSAPVYACRAWVNFNGTGTVAIRASGNVSSITDNGPGDYTVNFSTAMPDADYCATFGAIAQGTTNGFTTIRQGVAPTTSALRVATIGGASGSLSYEDNSYVNVCVFR